MMRCLTGRRTRSQVCIPVTEANSSLEALSQHDLSGDQRSCFQVFGASTRCGSVDGVAVLAQFSSQSGTFLERVRFCVGKMEDLEDLCGINDGESEAVDGIIGVGVPG